MSSQQAPALASSGRGGRAPRLSMAILFALYAVAYLDRQILNLLIDPIRHGLHLTDSQLSLLTGFAFTLFYGVSGLPMGAAVDRYSRKGLIFGGMIVWSLAASLCGLARNFWEILFARFGVGAGESVLLPAAYSLLADLFPKERLAWAMGVFTAGSSIGGGLSLILGGLLIGWATSRGAVDIPILGILEPWQQVLVASGLPGLLLAGCIFLVPSPSDAATRVRQANTQTFGDALRHMAGHPRFFACHILGFSLINVGAVGFLVWSPTFLHRHFGWSLQDVGVTFGAMSTVCGMTGSMASGALADFLFRRGVLDAHLRMYVWGALLLAASGIAAVYAPNTLLFFAFFTVAMIIKTFAGVAASAIQITVPAALRGKVSAIYLAVFTILGGGLGPLIVALFTDYLFRDPSRLGHSMALSYAIVLPLGAAVLALGLPAMRAIVRQQAGETVPTNPACGLT